METADLPPLERPCPHCTEAVPPRSPRDCDPCRGTGRIPTPAGRQILDLVRTHGA